jgi:RHS repeat-associated protein
LRKFFYGPGLDEPICLVEVAENNAVYYYHFDGLGSVVALSDVNSVLVERYTYDVFGRPTIRDANGTEIAESAFANPYLFTGRAYDAETGLYYYRARYYDYATGRFLQPDPTGYTDGLNLYAYVGNNPCGFVDPSGLCKEQSALERAMLGLCGLGVSLFETISNSIDSMPDAALHPWRLSQWYLLIHMPEMAGQLRGAAQQFYADITSPDAERNGGAIGRLVGSIYVIVAAAGITQGITEGLTSAPSKPAGLTTAPNKPAWRLGGHKGATEWQNKMAARGWTPQQIDEAITGGQKFPAANNVNPGNAATRYVHPETGRSVVIDEVTGEVLHVGGDGYKY